jgi:hypothetical protein
VEIAETRDLLLAAAGFELMISVSGMALLLGRQALYAARDSKLSPRAALSNIRMEYERQFAA